MSESETHSSLDAEMIRAFISAAFSRGVPGYRADYILDCLRRLEEQLEAQREVIFWLLQGYDDAHYASSQDMALWAGRARDLLEDSNPAKRPSDA